MTLTISSQLNLGSQGDDVARLQAALVTLGRLVAVAESSAAIFGPSTVGVVKALQQESGVPVTGALDVVTVRAINAKLDALPGSQHVVRGAVRDRDGRPFADGFIDLFRQTPNGEQGIGSEALDKGAGTYEIVYSPTAQNPAGGVIVSGRLDLRLAVRSSAGPVETTPSGTNLLVDAGLLEVVDFVVTDPAHPASTEFDRIVSDLTPLLAGRTLASLAGDSTGLAVATLASQSGYPPEAVAAVVMAHKLQRAKTDGTVGGTTPPAVVYALLRQGHLADEQALNAADPGLLKKSVAAAVAAGVVPAEVGGVKLGDYLAGFASPVADRLKGVVGSLLKAEELPTLAAHFLANSQSPAAFWKAVETDPAFASRAATLKLTAQVASLTNNQPGLAGKVLAFPSVKTAKDIVNVTADQWRSLIQQPDVGVPAGTPGSTDAERTEAFVRQILRQLEAAFPGPVLGTRLPASPVATFFKASQYDLGGDYPAKFFAQKPDPSNALSAAERAQVRDLTLAYRVTGDVNEAMALHEAGASSALQIARMDRATFAAKTANAMPAARAAEIHSQARATSAAALAFLGEHSASLNRTDLRALPRLDTEKQASIAQVAVPNWQSLFGGFDFCACEECAAAHGPAAYFVDILQFLDQRGVRDALLARRPDLGDLELSCENTNTPLPYIDLANEILENAVAPPAPFLPFTLAPALEADLGEPVASPALSVAFAPPLQSGTRIEILPTGTRWRVLDEAFAYAVVKDAGVLKVVARSRQTSGAADERRATPEYRNRAAYDELASAVFPWSLPFSLPAAETEAFLTYLGVTRRELIEALSPTAEPFDPTSPIAIRLAAEGLGMTATERKIMVGEALSPPRALADFWGGTALPSPAPVDKVLALGGLTYADLAELVGSRFVNPAGAVSISAAAGAAIDTCDSTELQIAGSDEQVLDRLQRFARLRAKMGWKTTDLDRAILALSPAAGPGMPRPLTNEILVRLDHLRALRAALRLSVVEVLAFWGPLDTRDPGSLYGALFYNKAIFNPQADDFRLTADGAELFHTNVALADHAAVLQSVFRLNVASFTLLASKTDGKLTLANLSYLFRHAVLARQLGMGVADLLTVIDLTGLDPFQAARTEDTIRFVAVVKAMAASGFTIGQLDYLLRHRANPAAPFVPTDPAMAQMLEGLRADLAKIDAANGATSTTTALTDADKQSARRSAIIDRTSAALGLPADVTADLLGRVSDGADTSLQILGALAALGPGPVSRASAPRAFAAVEKLLKVATIIQAVGLPGTRLDWLFRENSWLAVASDPPPAPVPFTDWYKLIELRQLQQALPMQNAALEALLGALSTIVAAANPAAQTAAKAGLVTALEQWLGWPSNDVQALIGDATDLNALGALGARLPDDYRGSRLILRLARAMKTLGRLAVTVGQALALCDDDVNDAAARAVRAAAKAKQDDATWQKVVTPLQDTLRDQQRAALVSYLVARPATWSPGLARATATDLYGAFLVDVEMCSCQISSRLVQAIGSVQLFAQRVLLGLEALVAAGSSGWQQWEWMKSFRVWEANRKVWLYPENWIDPALREDKSPFFEELESELAQSDLDNDAAETALLHYLQKLDRVAHLQIVGEHQGPDGTLHVFGRTWHTPQTYYYRRRDAATGAWTPWTKVDLDIQTDHLIPVVWNSKLFLVWAIFTEKSEDQPVVMPQPRETMPPAARYWEIQLAWSECRHDSWSGKSLSGAVSLRAYLDRDDVGFDAGANSSQTRSRQAFLARDQGDVGGLNAGHHGPGYGGITAVDGGFTLGNRGGLVDKDLVTFRAAVLDSGDLAVRGFLRRDYRSGPGAGDQLIGCYFGEFQLASGGRGVSVGRSSAVENVEFVLAPAGTEIDSMGFTSAGSGLTLFDGPFPASPSTDPLDLPLQADSIVDDPSNVLGDKLDIPVLGATPRPFRVLGADQSFAAEHPLFFTDARRSFLINSTGATGKRRRQVWLDGNLAVANRSDFFELAPAPAPPLGPPAAPVAALTLLVPGAIGEREAVVQAPVNVRPAFRPVSLTGTFWTTREYRFESFHHPYVPEFIKAVAERSIPGLLSRDTQSAVDPQSFDAYEPAARVKPNHPVDEVDFRAGGAYEVYNWELFFHIPLLIAARLTANQRFADAQRWLHYIFDPTAGGAELAPQRYWQTLPFYRRVAEDYEAESVKVIEELLASVPSEADTPDADATRARIADLKVAVAIWRANPFQPHAVARLRTTAYQKAVVMRYIDNLIAWGDQLFRSDTLETLNLATQLYVLAGDILGPRPEIVDRGLRPAIETYNTLLPKLGELSNALADVELIAANLAGTSGGDAPVSPPPGDTPDPPSHEMLYFCVPENDELVARWSTVADRLFKIRHCMNIDGQRQQLPLFAPPIDPGLLVRAQAAGVSIADVLSEISAPLPSYRFAVMYQKASEVLGEVRSLGGALLAALEKRDAEALSTLRSGQELRLLQAVRAVRLQQVDEAEKNIAALEKSRALAQARKSYYESRSFPSMGEATAMALSAASMLPLGAKEATEAVGTAVSLVPDTKMGAPTTDGASYGASQLSGSSAAAGRQVETTAALLNISAMLANRIAEYTRRQDEWDHQANLATIELAQIDQQLAAAEIRQSIAAAELANHDQQTDDAAAVDELLRRKFTNRDLYDRMVAEISGVYFQSYQLAYDLAKRAEVCLQHELGLLYGQTSIITFGAWDSLKKGLLAGDHLAYDLKRLDAAFCDGNIREYELTKHVSLATLAPEQFLALRETGSCTFAIPEWLFDLDTPGHFLRRLKWVSLTIPCVTGPYTTVHCRAQLLNSSFRRTTDTTGGYAHRAPDDPAGPDSRFIDDRKILESKSIVTSSAQGDAGLFEPTTRDERYLPFEGAGAVGTWQLDLPNEFRTFPYGTISDVIMHLRYTAREGGEPLRSAAVSALQQTLADVTRPPLSRLVSLRQEFPAEWARFVGAPTPAGPPAPRTFTFDLSAARFPFFVQGRSIAIARTRTVIKAKSAAPSRAAVTPGATAPDLAQPTWSGAASPGVFTFGTDVDPKSLEDAFVIVDYGA